MKINDEPIFLQLQVTNAHSLAGFNKRHGTTVMIIMRFTIQHSTRFKFFKPDHIKIAGMFNARVGAGTSTFDEAEQWIFRRRKTIFLVKCAQSFNVLHVQ